MEIKNLFTTMSANAQMDDGNMSITDTSAPKVTVTYLQSGKTNCGKCNGSLTAFSAMLQRIYNAERQRQIDNKALQEQRKNDVKAKINDLDVSIKKEKTQKDYINDKIDKLKESIKELKESLVEAKNDISDVTKTNRVKMIVGLVILLPLSVYLFRFYIDMISKGFSGLIDDFAVYFAPLIFFGLGYALHFFATQENKAKYVKIAAVVAATFIFDLILAYNISEQEYVELCNNTLDKMPPYSPSIAFHDLHVWGVIMFGFIAYIIWGVVFDMTMTAYENMKSNKKEVEKLKSKIETAKDDIEDKCKALVNVDNNITQFEGQKKNLEQKLSTNVFINMQEIKEALSDFHAGWISVMTPLGIGQRQQQETHRIYNETVAKLFDK